MLRIGPHSIDTSVVLAPMVGVTDHPFRQLCHDLGTRLAITEMVAADSQLWQRRKSRMRMAGNNAAALRWVQIVGNDPVQMAEAARMQADLGAEVIDINMGCPAKTVCRKAAGSALLRDEALVADILERVVAAVPSLPVTLKMRTGWSPSERNGVRIARIAEASGVQLLSVHGRTRQCRFGGDAEYDTIRSIVAAVSIPVIANGDIDSVERARAVLHHTGAAAVMIGRAAQGRPWLCGQIDAELRGGVPQPEPTRARVHELLARHLRALHQFHGEEIGPRIARKHVGWYLAMQEGSGDFLRGFHRITAGAEQLAALDAWFERNNEHEVKAA